MITKPAYSLSEVTSLPTSQVGNWARLLGNLSDQSSRLTNGFVVPVETLVQVATSNNLSDKLARWQEQTIKDPHLIGKTFQNLGVPSHLAHAWLKAFYAHVGDQPAFIRISWVDETLETIQLTQVKGDANVMEAILEVWGKAVAFQLQYRGSATKIVPGAVVVQAQPNPQVVGWVKTNLGLPHLKSAVLIRAAREAQQLFQRFDEYTVDVRTWHVLNRQTQSSQALLDQDQIMLIAQAGYKTKLQHLEHGRLDWTLNHSHLTPTQYLPESAIEAPKVTTTKTALMSGKSLIRGITSGRCHVVLGRIPTLLGHNDIIVTRTLAALTAFVLKQIRGVITESHIQPEVLKQLQAFHIPTMTHVPHATQRLREGQPIILDTVHNGIFGQVNSSRVTQTQTRFVIETAQELSPHLAELQPNEVLFRPDYTLVQFGIHPLHFIRSSQREILFKSLTDKLMSLKSLPHLIYRQSNISSSDLAGLQYGGQFEHPERNPDYGYRGALRALTQTELLDFELDALAHLHRHSQHQITFLVSGVRSPGEYRLIQQHLDHHLPNATWLTTWLEISTPENAIEYGHYHHLAHQGIIINLPQLHALAHGIDPHNQDVYRLYSWNYSLMKHLLHHVVKEAGTIPCYCICPSDQPSMLDLCLELNVAGIVVKPPFAVQAKEYMMTAEQNLKLV